MMNERWKSTFPYTLAFNLFKKHITELNKAYWSFVPAANTIISLSKKETKFKDDPKSFFLIHDEDEHRIASNLDEWKDDFGIFSQYTRLNMVMLISSCFETYLRTVVANAFESNPGVIIMAPGSVDGADLLKQKPSYANSNSEDYQFTDQVNEICKGEWSKRFRVFEKYFGKLSESIITQTDNLDELRQTRNNIGHYFGRTKKDYSAPIVFSPIAAQSVSEKRVKRYLGLVYEVARDLDSFMKDRHIGSYDIIKAYISLGYDKAASPNERAKKFRKYMGDEGFPPAGKYYYRNLISYIDLSDSSEVCRYSEKTCVKEIKRQLKERDIQLIRNGYLAQFNSSDFRYLIKALHYKDNPDYCQQNMYGSSQGVFVYSMKLINRIVEDVSNDTKVLDH